MSELLATQRAFAGAILNHQAEAGLLDFLAGNPEHNAALIAVYRGNAVANTLGALRLAYPVSEQVVGEECFAELARLYWRAHPPQSGDLNEYGEAFAAFITSVEEMTELPWLSDLARLEWAVHQASMTANHLPIGMAALAGLTPAQLAVSRLCLQPALQLIASDWPIASIWLQHQPNHEGELDLTGRGAEVALIHREELAAFVCSLPPCEASCIKALQAGCPLEQALCASADIDPQFDPSSFLQRAFAQELIIGITPGETP
ncbi:hypothetical protein GCM10027046_11130 [Uliginosibacterium flavum]|uniref:DNA-binding domain-containing protein n=1 Tax=Uliginosibacterium flavum TaxID=1396831 RepID=A0ABV2TNP9_9RHOO